MGLHKLTAGDGYTYLTRQVAAHDATERGHTGLNDYYDEKGESPGRWLGVGLSGLGLREGDAVTEPQMKALFGEGHHPNSAALEVAAIQAGGSAKEALAAGALGKPFAVYAGGQPFRAEVARAFSDHNRSQGLHWQTPIPAEIRARIRTELATDGFVAQHGRPPQDERELSGFLAQRSRQSTTAVAGYDLTFSPVKSVSTLWALAPKPIASEVQAAHEAAMADTLAWLEREVAFTRMGSGGARQVPVRGLIATAFTHRDSRAGDPDLHTHIAVSNKVQNLDGRWLALDGRMLYRANVAASERYNTRLEVELVRRLGVRFVDRESSRGKRPVREIDGIDPLLAKHWSRRRTEIEARRAELASRFQRQHGRAPTSVEAIALAQQATLETREAKHEPRAEHDQRSAWRDEAVAVLGDETAVDLMVHKALGARRATTAVTPALIRDSARRVVTELESNRATWTVWHTRAEAERQARRTGIGAEELEAAVDNIVDEALANNSIGLGAHDPVREPPMLQRPNGDSVYDVKGAAVFTSGRVLDAERRLMATAGRRDGRVISDVRVGIAVATAAAAGTVLNDGQEALVRDLATSGARLQLALAPAGTGKTTAMSVLAAAWLESGGWVLGLAPSAQAAHGLGAAIDGPTDTLTKLTWSLQHAPEREWPGWMRRIGPQTLVIIDEAGLAGTVELADAVDFITARGASVRLVGDDQQLASVAAGGILRELARTSAATLNEVRRFTDPAEAAVTLAVRDGDPSALGFYADHGRIHVGDMGLVTDQAYVAWAADRAAGRDSILLAPTRELTSQLNERARLDRLAGAAQHGPAVRLADGTCVSSGDTVITRRNERRLALSATDWVKNGDRWTVQDVHADGGLTVQHLELRRTLALPADYVREHVQLGYASTVHAAQGMTVDACHTVVTGNESRQLFYVAVTRGRTANHVYLANAHDGDPHSVVRPETLVPPTAIDVLAGILRRDGSQHSATSTQRELDSPAVNLHDAAVRYHDALGYAAEQLLGEARLAMLDLQAEALYPTLTDQPAYPTLRAHLALRAVDGADPVDVLATAAESRELVSADDRAAVLDWRIAGATQNGPLPWLSAVPSGLTKSPDWGSYLEARHARVVALVGQVHAEAVAWTPSEAPGWAAPFTNPGLDELRGDLAVWRAAYAVPETDRRPTGPRQLAVDAERHQRLLDRRVRAVSPGPGGEHPWSSSLPQEVVGSRSLLEHLEALERAGVDVGPLLATALSEERPLPVEMPTEALWWRIVRHLGPAALPASRSSASTLRPTWTPALVEHLGQSASERVMADSAWPALVAAVRAATDWSPDDLIRAVADGWDSDGAREVSENELCSALVWRIAVVTDVPHDPETVPGDPLDDEAAPPDDIHLIEAPSIREELTAARIVELNAQASDFYARMYGRSWAPAYLRDRLGTDLTQATPFVFGYAPPGPTSLIRHLTSSGATERELVEAGLARLTDRGRLIDAFRDRLMFPIQKGDEVVGFIGRRNPQKDTSEYGGPKYLNTRSTAAFAKGDQLYGLADGQASLRAGAAPVLVEGPLDAIAVTLAGNGKYVGIAPLGTAFTPTQAAALRDWFRDDPEKILVATDADPAGWASAQRAFWQLAALGADPRHVSLPEGTDPAELLRLGGEDELRAACDSAAPVAEALIRSLIAESTDSTDAPATRLRLVRQSGQIIGARPPGRWLEHAERVSKELDLPRGMLHMEVVDAGAAWSDDPVGSADRRIEELRARSRAPWSATALSGLDVLLQRLPSGVRDAPGWPELEATMRRAQARGHDPVELLGLSKGQLVRDGEDAVVELRYRLLVAMGDPPVASPAPPTNRPAAINSARTPMTSPTHNRPAPQPGVGR